NFQTNDSGPSREALSSSTRTGTASRTAVSKSCSAHCAVIPMPFPARTVAVHRNKYVSLCHDNTVAPSSPWRSWPMQKHSLDGNLGEKTDLEGTILDTARTVFETYGVRRANIEDVAARAGVSRSTIYRRFPTK